jgi:hypothetical protein
MTIMLMGSTYVQEPRPPTGLLLSPEVYVSVERHGNNDAGRGKLQTHSPELSGSPTSRDIWERVDEMDEGLTILHIGI